MFTIIKKIIAHFKSVPYTDEQLELFKRIIPGDVIYAKMPLDKEELNSIDPTHRQRPYLVIKKEKDYLITYPYSTVNRTKKMRTYEYFKSRNKGRISYLYLQTHYDMPIENIIHINGHLSDSKIQKIDKRLYLKRHRNGVTVPRFNVRFYPECSDIVQVRNRYYLILSHKLNKYRTYEVFLQAKHNKLEHIVNNHHDYYIDYLKEHFIDDSENFKYLDITNLKTTSDLQRLSRNTKALSSNKYFSFPLGQTFYVGGNQYLYCYSRKGNIYGIEIDEDSFSSDVSIIDKRYKRNGECLPADEANYILCTVLKDKKNKDIHDYYQIFNPVN